MSTSLAATRTTKIPEMRRASSLLLLCALAAGASAGNRAESIKLWASAWNGDVASVKSGLSAGGDPNWLNRDDDEKGHSAVTAAAKRGHADVLNVLLGHSGIDVCVRDSEGMSALDFALKKGTRGGCGCAESVLEKAPLRGRQTGGGGWFSSWFGGKKDL